jgi:hypothetical protein
MSQRKQVRDPMKTKTGKTRLGGLTVTQLTALADKEGRKKIRARILNRIRIVQSRKGSVEKVVVAESAE